MHGWDQVCDCWEGSSNGSVHTPNGWGRVCLMALCTHLMAGRVCLMSWCTHLMAGRVYLMAR